VTQISLPICQSFFPVFVRITATEAVGSTSRQFAVSAFTGLTLNYHYHVCIFLFHTHIHVHTHVHTAFCDDTSSVVITAFLHGRPFIKRFVLRYRTVTCLSVCLSVCPSVDKCQSQESYARARVRFRQYRHTANVERWRENFLLSSNLEERRQFKYNRHDKF